MLAYSHTVKLTWQPHGLQGFANLDDTSRSVHRNISPTSMVGDCVSSYSILYLNLPNPTFLWVLSINPNREFIGTLQKSRLW